MPTGRESRVKYLAKMLLKREWAGDGCEVDRSSDFSISLHADPVGSRSTERIPATRKKRTGGLRVPDLGKAVSWYLKEKNIPWPPQSVSAKENQARSLT